MVNLIAQKLQILGKPQSWLAIKTNLEKAYLNKIIKNKINNPKILNAHKIAKALNSVIEEIWIFDEDK